MAERRNVQKDWQDFEFAVSVPMINGEPFEILENDWDIHIRGTEHTASVQCRRGVFESVGAISANAEVVDGSLLLYCKSSKLGFGTGVLFVDMTIYAPHEKFEEQIQVLKTLSESIDICLI